MITVYVKVPVGKLPKEKGWYLLTGDNQKISGSSIFYFNGIRFGNLIPSYTHYLQEVELPNEEEIKMPITMSETLMFNAGFNAAIKTFFTMLNPTQ